MRDAFGIERSDISKGLPSVMKPLARAKNMKEFDRALKVSPIKKPLKAFKRRSKELTRQRVPDNTEPSAWVREFSTPRERTGAYMASRLASNVVAKPGDNPLARRVQYGREAKAIQRAMLEAHPKNQNRVLP